MGNFPCKVLYGVFRDIGFKFVLWSRVLLFKFSLSGTNRFQGYRSEIQAPLAEISRQLTALQVFCGLPGVINVPETVSSDSVSNHTFIHRVFHESVNKKIFRRRVVVYRFSRSSYLRCRWRVSGLHRGWCYNVVHDFLL